MKKRDVSIELIRIIGSMIVVALHCLCLFYSTTDQIYFFKAFLLNGVPLFWMIMGYFLFENRNQKYLERLWGMIKKIIIPAFLIMLVTELLLDYLNSQNTLTAVLSNPKIDWKLIFHGIMKWECARKEYEHLWYIFSYIKIMISFPVIRYICSQEKDKTIVRRAVIALLVIQRLSVEIQHLLFGATYLVIYTPLDEISTAYVLLGYEFHHYFEKIGKNRKIFYLAVYFISNVAVWVMNGMDMRINDTENFYHSAGSIGIMISSCMLFMFIKKLHLEKTGKIKNLILFVSGKTFGIYLIHYMIIRKIKSAGIVKQLQWNPLLEYIMAVIAVYMISFLAVLIWKILKEKMRCFFCS